MTSRMTNDETRRFIEAVNQTNALGGNEAHVQIDVITKIAQEISAGRSAEAEKDATIKALADALLRNGFWVDGGKDWHSRRCPQSLPPAAAPCTCSDDRGALRLAWRL